MSLFIDFWNVLFIEKHFRSRWNKLNTRLNLGTNVTIFKIFSPIKIAIKMAFLTQYKAELCKILIITLVFEKNANFFSENWQKLQKIVIITSTPEKVWMEDFDLFVYLVFGAWVHRCSLGADLKNNFVYFYKNTNCMCSYIYKLICLIYR
jgi:hypothetical protein